jgi:hypothetical protein
LSENEEIKESISGGDAAEETARPCTPPEPAVTGNEHLDIISHSLFIDEKRGGKGSGAVITMKNTAGRDIGKIVFNIVFYGDTGEIIDTVEKYTKDLSKEGMRNFRVECDKTDADIRSYAVSVVKTVLTPEPSVTDNDKIKIITHSLLDGNPYNEDGFKRAIDISIKNIFSETFATVILEALFYDGEGNLLDTVRHKEFEIKPDTRRSLTISPVNRDADMFRTYRVSVYRTVTTGFEKVQLRSHNMKKTEGEAEVSGVVKNISAVKTDASVVTLFKDEKDEKIATRVIYIRDIEPGASKQFRFKFAVPPGEAVKSYVISIGSIVEEPAAPAA